MARELLHYRPANEGYDAWLGHITELIDFDVAHIGLPYNAILGHHMEASSGARPRKQGARREAPGAREFITKAIKELQEAQAMRGEHCPVRHT
jgi:hypothetical protein